MACLSLARKQKLITMVQNLTVILDVILTVCTIVSAYIWINFRRRLNQPLSIMRVYKQSENLHDLVFASDLNCVSQLRMNRETFQRLCSILSSRGNLRKTRNVFAEEMVAIFLYILAHHHKNRVVGYSFKRSGKTVNKYFHECLNAMIRCQKEFWKTPEPKLETSIDPRWKWFKNCLGALDGTYIRVRVPEADKPRYRTRKGETATNVLRVCSQDMQFIYVIPGWEGSAHDGRVLRDAFSRRNGLKVPNGYYYLVDAGYTNGQGFLAPFRGTRYHLYDWNDGYLPNTTEEFFNMKHSSARNVIERCFVLLKMRWAILRSPSFYDKKTQRRMIFVCCMLHNFIRREINIDPVENEMNSVLGNHPITDNNYINNIESSYLWTIWRQNFTEKMQNTWLANR
ncbi:hypothetical protein CsatB_001021 [Cannabis sativa]